MKKAMISLVLITSIATVSYGQTWQEKWSNMTREEQMMKMKSYRDDNQKFLKDSLGMTSNQLHVIDSVNSVFWKKLNQIERGPGSDEQKFDNSKEIIQKRSDALDGIMGQDKHMRFAQHVIRKLEKE